MVGVLSDANRLMAERNQRTLEWAILTASFHLNGSVWKRDDQQQVAMTLQSQKSSTHIDEHWFAQAY